MADALIALLATMPAFAFRRRRDAMMDAIFDQRR
jgi:hypothetical protein